MRLTYFTKNVPRLALNLQFPEGAGYREINQHRPFPKGPNSSAMFQADRRQLLDDERYHVMPGPEFEMRGDYSNSLPMVHVRGQ
ncbi:hypothetical protein LA080_006382 [Diaporthe eres]|nr:hypothetical protein LA080_006382 [Diaporthe eres]